MIHPTAFIHSKAYAEGVSIGARSKVWQFASVIRGAIVGDDCTVGANALIDSANTGNRCLIESGAKLHAGVQLRNDVFIGPNAVLCNDFWPRTHKNRYDIEKLLSGEVVCILVEDGASIGAGACIVPGVRIGVGAMVAANADVTADVPDGCLWGRDGEIRTIREEHGVERVRACR